MVFPMPIHLGPLEFQKAYDRWKQKVAFVKEYWPSHQLKLSPRPATYLEKKSWNSKDFLVFSALCESDRVYEVLNNCQLLDVAGIGQCQRLGTTIDDAAGEAFDKIAKTMGLPYPGGPALEAAAKRGTPRHALPRPLMGTEGALFASGELMLEGEDKPLAPAVLEVVSPTEALLTVTEGRYHQVRRMFAAVGNHVETLHRERLGGLTLPADLAPGQWRLLTPEEIALIFD
jgi:hypothetical protein